MLYNVPVLTEKKIFDLITDIRKHNFPDMYLFIGDVLELKLCLINEIKDSLAKKYATSAHLIKFSFKTNTHDIEQLLNKSMFSFPFIYWATDFDKLKISSKVKETDKPARKDTRHATFDVTDYLSILRKVPHKPEEHIVVCDYDSASWLWSKENLAEDIQSMELVPLNIVYFLSFEVQERYMPHWIQKFCKLYNYEIEMNAATNIAEYVGADIGKAIREIQKAFIYVLPYKNITITAIQECLSEHKKLSDFQLYDYFAEKDADATIVAVLNLREESYDPVDICRNLRNETEKMFFVQSRDPSSLVKSGLSPKSIPFLQKRAHKFAREELLRTLSLLDNAEKSMKENNKLAWDIFLSTLLQIVS